MFHQLRSLNQKILVIHCNNFHETTIMDGGWIICIYILIQYYLHISKYVHYRIS